MRGFAFNSIDAIIPLKIINNILNKDFHVGNPFHIKIDITVKIKLIIKDDKKL